jgi:endonuclease YncB( thermonuclease family)
MGICCSSDDDTKKKETTKVEEPTNDQKQQESEQHNKDRGILIIGRKGENNNNKPAATTTNNKPAATHNNHKPHAQQHHQIQKCLEPPAGTEIIKEKVQNVYDGDTLTLVDQRRVRFVHIDAPEIKDKEEGAQEAKELAKRLCNKKTIEIHLDPKERSDKYDRLIGLIYVTDDKTGERICVNAELLKAGVVSYYKPKGSEAFESLSDEMLSFQAEAMNARRGIWAHFVDDEVYKTRNGGSYHTKECEHVQGIHLDRVKRSEAIKNGMSACRTCHP